MVGAVDYGWWYGYHYKRVHQRSMASYSGQCICSARGGSCHETVGEASGAYACWILKRLLGIIGWGLAALGSLWWYMVALSGVPFWEKIWQAWGNCWERIMGNCNVACGVAGAAGGIVRIWAACGWEGQGAKGGKMVLMVLVAGSKGNLQCSW